MINDKASIGASKRPLNFREYLENRIIQPMTVILIIAFLARSSELWSFGLVRVSALPKPFPNLINAATGIAMAFAMETLTVAAFSVASTRYYRLKDIEISGDMPAKIKRPMISKLNMQWRIYGMFGLFGAICSTFAIVSYAIGYSSATSLTGIAGEVVTALAMQIGLIYFGVLHEREIADPVKEHMGLALAQVGTLAKSLGDKIAQGQHSDSDVRAFQRMIPPEMRRMLEPLIHGIEGVEMWDVRKVATFLLRNDTSDATRFHSMMRAVRRKMADHAHEAAYGISHAPKGNGYVCPAPSVFMLFTNEIEAMMTLVPAPVNIVQTTDKDRTSDHQEVTDTANRTGTGADTRRTRPPRKPRRSTDDDLDPNAIAIHPGPGATPAQHAAYRRWEQQQDAKESLAL